MSQHEKCCRKLKNLNFSEQLFQNIWIMLIEANATLKWQKEKKKVYNQERFSFFLLLGII